MDTKKTLKGRQPFALQAARGSFLAPFLSILAIIFLGRFAHEYRVISDILVFSINVFGLVLGIGALLGVRKHGARAILPQVLIGFVLSGLLLFLWYTNFIRTITAPRGSVGSEKHVNYVTRGLP